jgi:hypothetical protein
MIEFASKQLHLPEASGRLRKEEYRDARFAELDRQIAAQSRGSGASRPPHGGKEVVEHRLRRKPKRRSQRLPREYRQDLARMAKEHRKKYNALFSADSTLKERGARFYRSMLPRLRSGRPSIESVTQATQLFRRLSQQYPDDKPEQIWGRIYPKAIPNYPALGKDDRIAQQLLLRNRVRSRRNQRRRRRTGRKAA